MQKAKIEIEGILLDERETKQIIQCLKYCLHRLNEHSSCGLSKVAGDLSVRTILKGLENNLS